MKTILEGKFLEQSRKVGKDAVWCLHFGESNPPSSALQPRIRQESPDRPRQDVQRHLSPPPRIFDPDAGSANKRGHKDAAVWPVKVIVGDPRE